MSGLGKAIGSIFGGGGPTPPPTPTYTSPAVTQAQQAFLAGAAANQGQASTILTSPMGVAQPPNIAQKVATLGG